MKRHIGARVKNAVEDIAASMQMTQQGLIDDREFMGLVNHERTRLGLKPWTPAHFVKAIIEPARRAAAANQAKAAEQAALRAEADQRSRDKAENEHRIKILEQEKRIKELEAEVLALEARVDIMREAKAENSKVTKK